MNKAELPPIDCSLDEVKAEIRCALQFVTGCVDFHLLVVNGPTQIHEIAHVVASCILLAHGYHAGNYSKQDLNECQLIQEIVDGPFMKEVMQA